MKKLIFLEGENFQMSEDDYCSIKKYKIDSTVKSLWVEYSQIDGYSIYLYCGSALIATKDAIFDKEKLGAYIKNWLQ